jgi:hypothetical protein
MKLHCDSRLLPGSPISWRFCAKSLAISAPNVKRLAIGFGSGSSELTTVVEGYVMTPQGLHKLGFGHVAAGGSKMPGAAVPAVVAIASGNPVGLIVSSGMKIYGETSGNAKIEGRAKATADEVADQLKLRAQHQGWIS